MSDLDEPAPSEDARADRDIILNQSPQEGLGGIRVGGATKSVLANQFINTQDTNFNQGGGGEASYTADLNQSIQAASVDIRRDVNYISQPTFTNNYYASNDQAAITQWLCSIAQPPNFGRKHSQSLEISDKAPDTGQWVFKSKVFLEWRDKKSRRLWCYGIPGAGKTVLSSIIIDHLQTGYAHGKNVTCLYVYFEYKDHESQTLKNLLCSLLVQLMRNCASISKDIIQKYHTAMAQDLLLTSDDYIKMFISQLELFSRVYVVIDALDECSDDPSTKTLDGFLEALRQLPSKVHILFTSRPDIGLERRVQLDDDLAKLEINAHDDDLRKYLRRSINGSSRLKKVAEKGTRENNAFLQTAISKIVERSQGMFLLAHLHMEFLEGQYTVEAFNDGIINLPYSPDEFYSMAYERIEEQRPFKRDLAEKILTWLVFSEKPPTVIELVHAVSIRTGDRCLYPKNFVDEEELMSSCAGLVVVDKGPERLVRLSHYTVDEYIKRNRSRICPQAHSTIAEICLTYLSFDEFSKVPESPEELAERRQKFPLMPYAAQYWANHMILGVRGPVKKMAWDFLNDKTKLESALQVMENFQFEFDFDISGLHCAAYLGLHDLVKSAIENNRVLTLDVKTQRGETPLHWAVVRRQRGFVKFLIENGAGINVTDNDGRTAIHKAVVNKDTRTLEILLSEPRKANLELEDSQKYTPLRWAAAHGQLHMVRLLLNHGAEVDARDKDDWRALDWAAKRGHKDVVELLIQKSASPGTTLIWAAMHGKDSVVSILVQDRVDVNQTDKDGYTPLRWAVYYGYGKTAWLLIQARADINKADKEGLTPLHEAAKNSQKPHARKMMFLLLECGARINAQTKHELTPLHLAAKQGNASAVWLLLEKGADPKCRDNNGRTAVHYAVIEGHAEAVRLLVWKHPALLTEADEERRTPLHEAASGGGLGIVKMLLEKGAPVDSRDREGYTPLHRAVCLQHEEVVCYLVGQGADTKIPTKRRVTPQQSAIETRNSVIMNAFQ